MRETVSRLTKSAISSYNFADFVVQSRRFRQAASHQVGSEKSLKA